MNTDKRAKLALISSTFTRLSHILDSSRDSYRYYSLCYDDEKEHRSHRSRSLHNVRFGISARTAAELKYCRNVLCYIAEERKTPDASDFFCYTACVFGGYAMFYNLSERISKEFTKEEAKKFMELEYSELVAS